MPSALWWEADLTLAESPGSAGTSDVDLHGNFDSIVNLDAEIPHRALDLGVAEEELYCAEITGLLPV
jgi:hypothetical protein